MIISGKGCQCSEGQVRVQKESQRDGLRMQISQRAGRKPFSSVDDTVRGKTNDPSRGTTGMSLHVCAHECVCVGAGVAGASLCPI